MVEKSFVADFWPSVLQPFARAGTRLAEFFSPASEASSDDDKYVITIEVPGVTEEDISLDVQNGFLSLKGEKRIEKENKGENWYFSERQYGSFSRSFRLPADANEKDISAVLKDGVLTVSVPKTDPKMNSSSTRIEISAA